MNILFWPRVGNALLFMLWENALFLQMEDLRFNTTKPNYKFNVNL